MGFDDHKQCEKVEGIEAVKTGFVVLYSILFAESGVYPHSSVHLCVGEKNGEIKIISSFSVIKQCFVINVLNNKTIILLSLVNIP